jgi:hypothetical protein
MALSVLDLLADGAARGRALLEGYRPRMTKAEYLEFMRGLARQERLEISG